MKQTELFFASLEIDPCLFFLGSDEEIEAAEKSKDGQKPAGRSKKRIQGKTKAGNGTQNLDSIATAVI